MPAIAKHENVFCTSGGSAKNIIYKDTTVENELDGLNKPATTSKGVSLICLF